MFVQPLVITINRSSHNLETLGQDVPIPMIAPAWVARHSGFNALPVEVSCKSMPLGGFNWYNSFGEVVAGARSKTDCYFRVFGLFFVVKLYMA